MADHTTRLNLTLPTNDETADIQVLNDNFEKLDDSVVYSTNTPSEPFAGMVWLKPRS